MTKGVSLSFGHTAQQNAKPLVQLLRGSQMRLVAGLNGEESASTDWFPPRRLFDPTGGVTLDVKWDTKRPLPTEGTVVLMLQDTDTPNRHGVARIEGTAHLDCAAAFTRATTHTDGHPEVELHFTRANHGPIHGLGLTVRLRKLTRYRVPGQPTKAATEETMRLARALAQHAGYQHRTLGNLRNTTPWRATSETLGNEARFSMDACARGTRIRHDDKIQGERARRYLEAAGPGIVEFVNTFAKEPLPADPLTWSDHETAEVVNAFTTAQFAVASPYTFDRFVDETGKASPVEQWHNPMTLEGIDPSQAETDCEDNGMRAATLFNIGRCDAVLASDDPFVRRVSRFIEASEYILTVATLKDGGAHVFGVVLDAAIAHEAMATGDSLAAVAARTHSSTPPIPPFTFETTAYVSATEHEDSPLADAHGTYPHAALQDPSREYVGAVAGPKTSKRAQNYGALILGAATGDRDFALCAWMANARSPHGAVGPAVSTIRSARSYADLAAVSLLSLGSLPQGTVAADVLLAEEKLRAELLPPRMFDVPKTKRITAARAALAALSRASAAGTNAIASSTPYVTPTHFLPCVLDALRRANAPFSTRPIDIAGITHLTIIRIPTGSAGAAGAAYARLPATQPPPGVVGMANLEVPGATPHDRAARAMEEYLPGLEGRVGTEMRDKVWRDLEVGAVEQRYQMQVRATADGGAGWPGFSTPNHALAALRELELATADESWIGDGDDFPNETPSAFYTTHNKAVRGGMERLGALQGLKRTAEVGPWVVLRGTTGDGTAVKVYKTLANAAFYHTLQVVRALRDGDALEITLYATVRGTPGVREGTGLIVTKATANTTSLTEWAHDAAQAYTRLAARVGKPGTHAAAARLLRGAVREEAERVLRAGTLRQRVVAFGRAGYYLLAGLDADNIAVSPVDAADFAHNAQAGRVALHDDVRLVAPHGVHTVTKGTDPDALADVLIDLAVRNTRALIEELALHQDALEAALAK